MLGASLPPRSLVTMVRSRLRREVCLPPGTMAMPGSGGYQRPCVGLWCYRVCVYFHGSCCLWVLCWLQGARPPPGAEIGFTSHWSSTDLGGLCHRLGSWWYSGLGCCQGLCLCLSSNCSWGLFWCPCPHGTSKGHMKPEVWATSCGLVDVQGPCCCQSHY